MNRDDAVGRFGRANQPHATLAVEDLLFVGRLEPARRRDVGERLVRERGAAQEFAALRDHHPDDDWRLVDWKATARRNRLTVRTYEAERSQAVLLCVDTGRLMGATVGGVTKLDLACDAALRLASHALGHGDRVGCLAFSDRVHADCPPRKGRDHLARCADLLSDARADLAETSLVRCVQHLERRHRKRALLIVLTDVLDTGLAEDVLAPLTVVARRHRVLLVGIRDREIGAFAAAPPLDLDAICRQAVAQEMLRERRAALERLRRAGVATLDCDAEAIGPPLLARYLALTGRRAA